MLEKMKSLVKDKDLCVVATVSGGEPHCSLMTYVTNDECSEIYMVTHRETKKYKNLKDNPLVSLLIDNREEHTGDRRSEAKALTIAGVCQHIDDEDKKAFIRTRLLERRPHMEGFIDHHDTELLCIRVISFLLLDGLTDAHFVKL